MTTCQECGNSLSATARFCGVCGAKQALAPQAGEPVASAGAVAKSSTPASVAPAVNPALMTQLSADAEPDSAGSAGQQVPLAQEPAQRPVESKLVSPTQRTGPLSTPPDKPTTTTTRATPPKTPEPAKETRPTSSAMPGKSTSGGAPAPGRLSATDDADAARPTSWLSRAKDPDSWQAAVSAENAPPWFLDFQFKKMVGPRLAGVFFGLSVIATALGVLFWVLLGAHAEGSLKFLILISSILGAALFLMLLRLILEALVSVSRTSQDTRTIRELLQYEAEQRSSAQATRNASGPKR